MPIDTRAYLPHALAATAGICQDLAAELISDDGPNTVDAECHVIQSDEQDRHAAQKAKN